MPFFLVTTCSMSVPSKICPLTHDSDVVVSSLSFSAQGRAPLGYMAHKAISENITFVSSVIKMEAVSTKITASNIHLFCFIVCRDARTFIFVFTTLAGMCYFPIL